DDASADGTTGDGTALDDASADGTTGDGTALDDASADGTTGDGTALDGISTAGSTGSGTTGDGASADGTAVDGRTGAGASADGTTGNGASGDGVTGDGVTGDGAVVGWVLAAHVRMCIETAASPVITALASVSVHPAGSRIHALLVPWSLTMAPPSAGMVRVTVPSFGPLQVPVTVTNRPEVDMPNRSKTQTSSLGNGPPPRLRSQSWMGPAAAVGT
ncbi:hypothetical protein AB0C04_19260, partial [Micromonospora sp. NPDC048909]